MNTYLITMSSFAVWGSWAIAIINAISLVYLYRQNKQKANQNELEDIVKKLQLQNTQLHDINKELGIGTEIKARQVIAKKYEIDELRNQTKQLSQQVQELKKHRDEFAHSRIINIIYHQLEIVERKLKEVTINLKKPIQSDLGKYGYDAIKTFYGEAIEFGRYKNGSELKEKNFKELKDILRFRFSSNFSEFFYSLESSIALIINLCKIGFKHGFLNENDLKLLMLLVKSNFNLTEIETYINYEHKLYRLKQEYLDSKNPNRNKPNIRGIMPIKYRNPQFIKNLDFIDQIIKANKIQ